MAEVFQPCSGMGSILGSGEISSDWRNGLCRRDAYGIFALVYLLEGHGWFSSPPTGGGEVSAGTVMLLYPDIPHAYGPRPGDSWREIFITFDGPAFRGVMGREILMPERAVRRLLPVEYWARRLREVVAEMKVGLPLMQLLSVSHLLTLLIEFEQATSTTSHPAWLDEAVAVMSTAPTLQLNPATLAARYGLSYDCFRKQFRQWMRESPGRFLTRQVMRQASELLYSGECTIKEIADQLGFYDAFHFSKRFKEWTGLAPSQYRPGRERELDL